jgi:hypothetical protein
VRFLILAHQGDATATQVAARLSQRHRPEDTRLVSMEEIVFAPRWSHTLNGAKAKAALTLHDGTEIRNDQIGVVFNRLQYLDMPHFATSDKADREYAVMEMFALFLSWLKAVPCPIINPISSQNLAGPIHSSLAWQQLAGQAGLPTVRMRLTSSLRRYSVAGLIPYPVGPGGIGNVPACLTEAAGDQSARAFVAGHQVLGDVPAELVPGCANLASLSGYDLLLIHFASLQNDRGWKFNGIDPYPAVTEPAAIDAIVRLLEARS